MRDHIRSGVTSCAVVLLAVAVVSARALAQQAVALPSEATAFAAYRRDSRLVRIPNGQTLNIHCVGAGAPTVVMEAGLGQTGDRRAPFAIARMRTGRPKQRCAVFERRPRAIRLISPRSTRATLD